MKAKPELPSDLWEQLWTRLDSIVGSGLIEKPPGAFTVQEFAQRYKISYDSASGKIRRLVLSGKITNLGKGPNNIMYYGLKGEN